MSHSNSHRRQPGKKSSSSSSSSMVGTAVRKLATTAVVAYGAYKVYEYVSSPRETTEEEGGDDTFTLPRWISSLWSDDHESFEHTTTSTTQSGHVSRQLRTKPPPPKKVSPDPRTRHRLAQQSRRNCRQEIQKAYATCWPVLQKILDDSTNTIPLTQELRSLRTKKNGEQNLDRQEELWQNIQTETFTKFVATIYASSLLVLSLTLQLNWIAGQMFRQQQEQQQQHQKNDGGASSPFTARLAQEVMMQSHEYFKTQGLPLLINAVRRAIAATPMGEEWRPTTFVTFAELQRALERVDTHLERGSAGSSHSRNWIRIVLPDPTCWKEEDIGDDDIDDETERGDPLSSLLEAFWDLAESPAWQDAQLQTLQTTQQFLQNKGWGKEFLHPPAPHAVDADKETKEGSSSSSLAAVDPVQIPLAKLMAPFKTSCGLVELLESTTTSNDSSVQHIEFKSNSKRTNNSLLEQLQKLPAVLELGDVSFQE